jgi:hypothetical protein
MMSVGAAPRPAGSIRGMEVPLPPAPTSDLTARDRHLRSRALALTPSERLAAMRAILASSWAALERHPQGMAHWLRRNYRARALRAPRARSSAATP